MVDRLFRPHFEDYWFTGCRYLWRYPALRQIISLGQARIVKELVQARCRTALSESVIMSTDEFVLLIWTTNTPPAIRCTWGPPGIATNCRDPIDTHPMRRLQGWPMWIGIDDAIQIYGKMLRARFGTGAAKAARETACQMQARADWSGVKVWQALAKVLAASKSPEDDVVGTDLGGNRANSGWPAEIASTFANTTCAKNSAGASSGLAS
jgi:hypothetical protein